MDVPVVGKKYTWFKTNGTAKSRLDRFLVSEEWLQIWSFCKQYVQPRVVSDHCAIVMKSSVKYWGPRPFKTIDAWFMEPGFKEFVKEKWCSYNVQGNSIYRLKEKLKLLKVDLKDWNKNEYGCLETKKKQILRQIEDLDVNDDNNSLEEHDKLRRMELFSHLRLIDKQVESLCRQKSRANWFKLGDTNSKFFHSAIRSRRLKNEVKGVKIDHQWCEEPEVIRREAKNTFNQRFLATHDVGVNMGSMEFKTLPVEVSLRMVSSITEEEVKEAVWQCEGSKSPGPDGFNFNFIKNSQLGIF